MPEDDILCITYENKDKNIYNKTGKLDRLLSSGHHMLIHLGHLRAKTGPGTLRPSTSIDKFI
jgi:hypothetical protein